MDSKAYFNALCQANDIPPKIGSKIIDGRYKPYLSAIDNLYYSGNDAYDAKTNALNAVLKTMKPEEIIKKLS